jgi:hypothetical protein
MDRDDTDALIDALHAMSVHRNLILPTEIIVNGVRHDAGEYRLVRVGPVPLPERTMADDHPF